MIPESIFATRNLVRARISLAQLSVVGTVFWWSRGWGVRTSVSWGGDEGVFTEACSTGIDVLLVSAAVSVEVGETEHETWLARELASDALWSDKSPEDATAEVLLGVVALVLSSSDSAHISGTRRSRLGEYEREVDDALSFPGSLACRRPSSGCAW